VPIASAGVSKGKSLGNALLKSVLVIDFVLICAAMCIEQTVGVSYYKISTIVTSATLF